MNEEKKYLIALDIAMGCTGISVFSNDALNVCTMSVDTKSEKNHQMKLKLIADKFIEIKKKYPPYAVAVEGGFSRHNRSTQVIFRVHGVANYIFWDTPQYYFPPCTVKKVVGGKGNINKEDLREIIEDKYNIVFANTDESDSYAVGITYFIKNGILQEDICGQNDI